MAAKKAEEDYDCDKDDDDFHDNDVNVYYDLFLDNT